MSQHETVTVAVHGMNAFENALNELSESVAGKALSQAIYAGAASIRKEAKALTPIGRVPHYIGRKVKGRLVQPGNLRKQLIIKRIRNSKFSVLYAVGFSDMGFYAPFHEFGTSKMRATPILRPAFDNKKAAAIEHIKGRLAENIERARKKAYEASLRAGK